MKIRLLNKKEITQAAKIVGLNHSRQYERRAKEEIKAMFQKGANQPTYVAAEEAGALLGFAGYIQSWMDYDVYEIFWVNVSPDYQRQGIGKQLVARVIAEIKKNKNATLIILSANILNSEYYARHFKFNALVSFGKDKQSLMALKL